MEKENDIEAKFEMSVEFARIMPVYKQLPNHRKMAGLLMLKQWIEKELGNLKINQE